MGMNYVHAYFAHYPISEPTEDWDDRNALYCLRWDMNCSTLYPGNLRFRKICIDVMKRLTEKYHDGYEGWAARHGEAPSRGKLNDGGSMGDNFEGDSQEVQAAAGCRDVEFGTTRRPSLR